MDPGNCPRPGQQWGREHRELLQRITLAHFREAEQRGVTGRALLWDLARQEILDDLETFLEEDAVLRARHGTTLLMAEAQFGTGTDAPTVPFPLPAQSDRLPRAGLDGVQDPGTGLSFRGRIDRIDLADDGKSALVIDYKTGSPSSYNALETGRHRSREATPAGNLLACGPPTLAGG